MKNNLIKTLFLLLILISTISCDKKKEAHELSESPLLNNVAVGLGWDAPVIPGILGEVFDLDMSAFLVKPDGKTRSVDDDSDFCFYNNKVLADGAVKHTGDNNTGTGKGDDETISVESSKIPSDMDKVIFAVTFNHDEQLKHKFSQVSHAYIRIVNLDTGIELARYYLNEVAPNESTMIFGELYRSGKDWKFRVLKKGFAGGLMALAKSLGVDAEYRSEQK